MLYLFACLFNNPPPQFSKKKNSPSAFLGTFCLSFFLFWLLMQKTNKQKKHILPKICIFIAILVFNPHLLLKNLFYSKNLLGMYVVYGK